jgi:hypothetical protein
MEKHQPSVRSFAGLSPEGASLQSTDGVFVNPSNRPSIIVQEFRMTKSSSRITPSPSIVSGSSMLVHRSQGQRRGGIYPRRLCGVFVAGRAVCLDTRSANNTRQPLSLDFRFIGLSWTCAAWHESSAKRRPSASRVHFGGCPEFPTVPDPPLQCHSRT